MLIKVFRIIEQFIFMIGLLVFILLAVLNYSIFSENYVIRKMDKTSYFSKLTTDIKEEVSNYTIQSGFTKDLFNEVFTDDGVKEDLIYVINSYYNKKSVDIDYTTLKENINNRINNYLAEKNAKADSKDLDRFTNMICDVYKTRLTVGNNLKYLDKISTISKISNILLPILFIGILIIVIFKIIKKDIEFLISPVIATSFIYMFSVMYIKNKIDIKNILIFGKNFSVLLKSIIFSILKYFWIISIMGLIIALLTIILLNIRKDKLFKKACFFYKKVV